MTGSLRKRIERLENRGPSPTELREAMRQRSESGELPTDPVLASYVLEWEAILVSIENCMRPPSSPPAAEPQSSPSVDSIVSPSPNE